MSESKKKESPDQHCVCFVEEKCTCGPFKRWGRDGMFKVNEFTEDVAKHLQTLKIKVKSHNGKVLYLKSMQFLQFSIFNVNSAKLFHFLLTV